MIRIDALSRPTVIDVFSGPGGMSEGFKTVGFNVVLAIEKNPYTALTYQLNHPTTDTITGDIRDISFEHLNLPKTVDVIVGGFPCRPFSGLNQQRRRSKGNPHPDEDLFKEFIRSIRHYQPSIFIMENVAQISLVEGPEAGKTILDSIISELGNLGYLVDWKVRNMSFYGVPQSRERLFVIGSRNRKIVFPEPPTLSTPNFVTVLDALSDLPNEVVSNAQAAIDYTSTPKSTYQVERREASAEIYNHYSTKHGESVMKRIESIPEGGNYKDIPVQLLPFRDVSKTHSNLYRRLRWDSPAPTIAHIRKTVLIHPKYNRTLSAREGARLQGFDDRYKFVGNKDAIYQQIADAVPPIMSRYIAQYVIGFL